MSTPSPLKAYVQVSVDFDDTGRIRKNNVRQISTQMESVIVNILLVIRDGNACQFEAVCKSVLSNTDHTLGDSDTRQR